MDPDAIWAEQEFGAADLGDVRRNARLVQLASVLGAQPSASLPEATNDPATLKAAYYYSCSSSVGWGWSSPDQILSQIPFFRH